MSFEEMWAELAPVGRSASSGGYFRQPWTSAESELRDWFRSAATGRGLEVEQDGLGNLMAWWRPAGASGPAVLTGSHLDSVLKAIKDIDSVYDAYRVIPGGGSSSA